MVTWTFQAFAHADGVKDTVLFVRDSPLAPIQLLMGCLCASVQGVCIVAWGSIASLTF